jgi:hypothetical protein
MLIAVSPFITRYQGGGCYYDTAAAVIITPGQAYLIESVLSFIVVYVRLFFKALMARIDKY